ncbi:fatty acyl-AMP ligase [Amycolatopsis antarctica]|uniref:fatty acyl-AMP ligase n=1 Tax=Amycolatopsis antarctica TaxID=1854586 RepID=UPI00196AD93A|nr:fatty acyl-AMP ligase [Amycolatopsis antarctica]
MNTRDAADVTALMRSLVERAGDRRAVAMVGDPGDPADPGATDDAVWWTYRELDERARAIAVWLRERAEPGARVMLLFPNGLDFTGAFFGCLYAGMVAVPAPVPEQYSHSRRRLEGIAADADVSFVLTESAVAPPVTAWAAEAAPAASLLVTDRDPLGDPGDWSPVAAGQAATAVLQYTSGSTAAPKGVVVTHGNLLHNAATAAEALKVSEAEGTRFGGWIPNYHDMGLMGHLLPPLFAGTAAVLMSPSGFLRRPVSWLRLIDRFDVTVSAAPNFAFELCARRVTEEQLTGLDLSRWRVAVNGSEPVRASVLRTFAERFAGAGFRPETMTPCFGMAEATLFVSGTCDREPVVRRASAAELERHLVVPAGAGEPYRDLVSCGAVHDLDVRIVDPGTGAVLPEARVGEVWLRGPSVAHGYWRNAEATETTFDRRTADGEGGFLRTGDFGMVDGGELYVTGRLKETLVIRGRNIYPQDVEHELRTAHRELAASVGAVFTVRDTGAEAERLIVTHEVRRRLPPDDLAALAVGMRKTVTRQFGAWPSEVFVLRQGTVRRTTSGKIQRAGMRELYLAGTLPALHHAAAPGGESS